MSFYESRKRHNWDCEKLCCFRCGSKSGEGVGLDDGIELVDNTGKDNQQQPPPGHSEPVVGPAPQADEQNQQDEDRIEPVVPAAPGNSVASSSAPTTIATSSTSDPPSTSTPPTSPSIAAGVVTAPVPEPEEAPGLPSRPITSLWKAAMSGLSAAFATRSDNDPMANWATAV